MIIEFEVPGRPVTYVRTTQKQKFVDPRYAKYRDFKNAVAWYGKLATKEKMSGDISVQVTVYLTGQGRGDLDNYVKGLLDGCNQVCFEDDRQVVEIIAKKIRVAKKEEQKAEIIIKPAGELMSDAI